ncbi:MAG TPA: hypothetical protein VK132_05925 [Gemmatimonadales bacterium]|nr:hypothetical protein [Gemmatimonadales bacterium]
MTVSLTTAEFVEVQQLPAEALRTRFDLSPSCQPALTALATDPAAQRMTVLIECRAEPPATSPGPRPPAGRSRPSRPAEKGS